jgi:hypothetical protein
VAAHRHVRYLCSGTGNWTLKLRASCASQDSQLGFEIMTVGHATERRERQKGSRRQSQPSKYDASRDHFGRLPLGVFESSRIALQDVAPLQGVCLSYEWCRSCSPKGADLCRPLGASQRVERFTLGPAAGLTGVRAVPETRYGVRQCRKARQEWIDQSM